MTRFSVMHNDYLDPDKHNLGADMDSSQAADHQTVLDFFSAETEDQCKSRMFKYTSCGAWLEFTETGILIGHRTEEPNAGWKLETRGLSKTWHEEAA